VPELLDERPIRRIDEIFGDNKSKLMLLGGAASTVPFPRVIPELERLVVAENFDDLFAELSTLEFIDVLLWIRQRQRRLALLSCRLLCGRVPQFIGICLHHCDMLEA
jgi:hypothetical protein